MERYAFSRSWPTRNIWLWEKILCTEVGTSVGLAWVCVRPPAWQKERGHEQGAWVSRGSCVGLAWVCVRPRLGKRRRATNKKLVCLSVCVCASRGSRVGLAWVSRGSCVGLCGSLCVWVPRVGLAWVLRGSKCAMTACNRSSCKGFFPTYKCDQE